MKKTILCTLAAAAACTALADATAYWTYANNTITDGEWTLKTTGTADALVVGAPTVKPSHGILDLTKPIDGGGAIVGIAANNTFYGSGLVSIAMPDTVTEIGYKAFWGVSTLKNVRLSENLETIGYQAFYNCGALTDVTPFLPASVTTLGYGAFDTCTKLKGALSIAPGGEAVTFGVYGSDCNQFNSNTSITNITFGAGVTTLPANSFKKCTGVREMTFLGSLPTLTGEAFNTWDYRYHSGGFQQCGQCRIHVPDNDPAWQAWVAAHVTPWDDLTDTGAKNYYATRWTDGVIPYGRVKDGYSANGLIIQNQWLCFYTPESASEETKDLVVTGAPGEYGTVSPAYGTYADIASSPGLPLVLTAPQQVNQGLYRYVCTGYVLEDFADMAWCHAVTNALDDPTAPSVSYNPSESGVKRLSWLWEVVGYALTVSGAPDEEYGAVSVAGGDGSGYFAAGATATVTATAGSAAFLRWHGDVPAGRETDATLTIVMDGPKTLIPEFTSDWVYSSGKVTDGHWTLNVSGARDSLTVGTATKTAAHGHLDLTKPIVDGGSFTAIGNQAFLNSAATKVVELPDTVTSIGNNAFQRNANLVSIRLSSALVSIGEAGFYQCEALAEVSPFLPSTIISLGYSCFNGCSRLGGVLTLGQKDGLRFGANFQGGSAQFMGTAITGVAMGAGVTNIPSQCFMRCYSLKSVSFGKGLLAIGNQAFYQCGAIREARFTGALPAIADNAFAGWTANQGRLFLPRTEASWDNWLAGNATAWNDLPAATQAAYESAWPGEKKPAGRTLSTANPATQWVLRYLPGNAPTTILVQ